MTHCSNLTAPVIISYFQIILHYVSIIREIGTAQRALLEYCSGLSFSEKGFYRQKWTIQSQLTERFERKANRLITTSHKQLPHQYTEYRAHIFKMEGQPVRQEATAMVYPEYEYDFTHVGNTGTGVSLFNTGQRHNLMHFKQNNIYQRFPSYRPQEACGPRTFARDRQWFIFHKRINYSCSLQEDYFEKGRRVKTRVT